MQALSTALRGRMGAAQLLLLPLLLLLPGSCQDHEQCPSCLVCPLPPAICILKRCIAQSKCTYSTSSDNRMIITTTTEKVYIVCMRSLSLDDELLPRFELDTPLRVEEVEVNQCAPPNSSYAAALSRLGVRLRPGGRLKLLQLPGLAKLRAHHFHGLELSDLALEGVRREPALPDVSLLKPLHALTSLWVGNVALSALALQQLPKGLLNLSLINVVSEGLPPLELPRLQYLKLELCEKCASISHVKNASLAGVSGTLVELMFSSDGEFAPPSNWLAGCNYLTSLTLEIYEVVSLPYALLRGAPALTQVTLRAPELWKVPPDLLQHTPRLTSLSLHDCGLNSLDDLVFSRTPHLNSLDLSYNRLSGNAHTMLQPLGVLNELRELRLDDNILGDLCPPGQAIDRSPLFHLKYLETLSLKSVGAERICPDWRTDLHRLTTINLNNNNITKLEYADLSWEQTNRRRVRVLLEHNPLTTVELQESEYWNSTTTTINTVEFTVNGTELTCDCHTYWFAHALRERRLQASFLGLQCGPPPERPDSLCSPRTQVDADPELLPFEEFDLNLMVCLLKEHCPRGCYCDERFDLTLRVECVDSNYADLPDLNALPNRHVSLCVASNRLTHLPGVLPAWLSELDLRDNLLVEPNATEVAALFADNRTVHLAGNRLACGCPSPLLMALPAHLHQVKDADLVRCTDNRTLHEALLTECKVQQLRGDEEAAVEAAEVEEGWYLTPILAIVALLVLLALLLLFLRRNVRLRLKAALLARGLCLHWAKPRDNDDSRYDVFLAFSHHDVAVAEEIIEKLESGPEPLRLCVHHRDWRAGDFIPAQIALSVAKSRRTVVLLSENFVKSSWARAEFREAYARSLQENEVRLIVVVLGAAPPTGLDSELQHYVSNNTYVRWGEPAFWEKLRLALPPPRLRPPPRLTADSVRGFCQWRPLRRGWRPSFNSGPSLTQSMPPTAFTEVSLS